MRQLLQPQKLVQQHRTFDERVFMNASQSCKFSFFQPGNHSENPFLLAVLHFGLKTDHVAQRVFLVVLPQLNHGVGFFAVVRIRQADRFHRAENQRFDTSFGHYFNRQAAVKILCLFKIVKLDFLRFQQFVDKAVIFFFRKRAVDVVQPVALVIAGLIPGF